MALRLAGSDPDLACSGLGLVDLDQVPYRPAPAWMVRAWGRRAVAMTLPWAIYVNPRLLAGDRRALSNLLLHELVHVRQWHALGTVSFLRTYLGDYWRARRSGLDHLHAYLNISLEEEARRISGH